MIWFFPHLTSWSECASANKLYFIVKKEENFHKLRMILKSVRKRGEVIKGGEGVKIYDPTSLTNISRSKIWLPNIFKAVNLPACEKKN